MSEENPTVEELEAKYKNLLANKIKQMEEAMNAEESTNDSPSGESEDSSESSEPSANENVLTKDDLEAFKATLLNEIKENEAEEADDPTDEFNSNSEDEPMTSTEEKPEDWSLCSTEVKMSAKKAGIEVPNDFVPRYTNENLMKAYVQQGIEAFSATDADNGCEDDVSAWENEDYFVDTIWFDVICQSDFLGKVGHRKYDYKAGAGGQVQIKQINIPSPAHDWGDAASLDPCECISCVSNSFSTYTVQIKKYGDMREICNADMLLAGNEIKGAILESMKIRLAERIDNEIWSNLVAASGSYSATLSSECSNASRGTDGDCCTYSVDLFQEILDLYDEMWNAGYFRKSGAVLIANKTLTALLKYKDGLSPQIQNALKFEGTSLKMIGDIKVIESCHAPSCASSGAGDTVAVLIDPARAFAEVWAQRPKYQSDPNIDCDSVTHVVWAYGAFDTLDADAIGDVNNP